MFKKNIPYLGFNDFWFAIISIILLGFLIPQIFFGVQIMDPQVYFPKEWLEASCYTTGYWIVNRVIIIESRKRYPSFEMVRKRLTIVIISSLISVTLAGMLLRPLISLFFECLDLENTKPSALDGFSATYTVSFTVMTIYESIWYYSKLKSSIQEQEQVKSAHVQSQLDGLRNQVNPHFLFNSLNTLNHIVEYEDKAMAKNFINQLSKVYRYILDSREEPTIDLAEEIEFIHAYISIQKERFLDNLNVKINIPQKFFHKKIIPLSLQLLIENAIKHNVISTKKPLTITIEIDEKTQLVRVTNNLQKKSKVLHSTKVGLQNIIERYQLLSDKKVVNVEELESSFMVSIPLLD